MQLLSTREAAELLRVSAILQHPDPRDIDEDPPVCRAGSAVHDGMEEDQVKKHLPGLGGDRRVRNIGGYWGLRHTVRRGWEGYLDQGFVNAVR